MKRAACALALVALSACGRSPASPVSPSAPVPAATDFSGLWTGSLKYTQCSGMRHCFARIGASDPFSLRVRQSGAHARALFTVSGYAVMLEGGVRDDGGLVLTGSTPFASDSSSAGAFDVAVTVSQLSVRLSADGRLAGTGDYSLRANQENSELFDNARLVGDVVDTVRRDLATFTASVDGKWTGRFVVRTCVPIGPVCEWNGVGDVAPLELHLAQAGDAVTGTVKLTDDVPVTGRVAGTSITLTGETSVPVSGGSQSTTITAWTAAVDGFGVMTGTFDYVFAYPASAPRFGSSAHADLWQLVKNP